MINQMDVSTQTTALTSREPSPSPFRTQPSSNPIQRNRLKLMIPAAGIIGAGVGYGINRWLTQNQPPTRKQLGKNVRAIRQW